MKKHFSLNRLLHKEKLMMLISLILAIVIWAVVDYDQGYTYEVTFHNVPVQVQLSEYATKNGLRVVKGDDITATVRVSGTRSVLKSLRAEDITLTAKAESILYDGRYMVTLLPTVSEKCDIVDVTGADIVGSRLQDKGVWIECMRFVDKDFALTSKDSEFALTADQVKMPNLTWGDGVELAAIVLDDDAVKDGKITVNGSQTAIGNIKRVGLIISETKTMTQTERFTGTLKAYDDKGQVVEGVTFTNPQSGEVGVVVRVITYRTEQLEIIDVSNAPQGMDNGTIRVTPQQLVLGEISGEKPVLDSYVENIRNQLTVDFDDLLPADGGALMIKNIPLTETDGIYFGDQSVKSIVVSLDIEGYTYRTVTLPLSESNVVIQCDEGYEAMWNQQELKNVVLCGPKTVLDTIDLASVVIEIDARGQAEGGHTVSVRPQVGAVESGDGFVWVYYGENEYKIEYSLRKGE